MGRPRRKANFKLPAHVHAVKARGKDYYYYHPKRGSKQEGERIKLPGSPFKSDGTPDPDWWQAYRDASGNKRPSQGKTFSALVLAYKTSPEWNELKDSTRTERARHLAVVESAWGNLAVAGLEAKHVLQLRDSYADTPAAANNIIRSLSSMMSWSIPRGWRQHNPCVRVKKLKIGEGYSPWQWEEIERFALLARRDLWHAAALALYTGQRLGDVLEMLWSDCKDGLIWVTQNKTGKKLWIPQHSQLKVLLADIPRVSVNIITNTRGQPWTTDGFKSAWSDEMKRDVFAPLRAAGRVFHGLRKSAVVFLLEAGATDAEVSSITGQSRQMVEHYSKQVNQKRLASAAISKWEIAETVRTKNRSKKDL
jgi:integrase